MLETNPYLNKSGYQLQKTPKLFVHEDKNTGSIKLGRSYVYQTKSCLGKRIGAILLAILSLGLSLISKSCRNTSLGRKWVEVKVFLKKGEYREALEAVSQEKFKKIYLCYMKKLSLSKEEDKQQDFMNERTQVVHEALNRNKSHVQKFLKEFLNISFPPPLRDAAYFENMKQENQALIQQLREQLNHEEVDAFERNFCSMNAREIFTIFIALEMEKLFESNSGNEELNLKLNRLEELWEPDDVFNSNIRCDVIHKRIMYLLNPEKMDPIAKAVLSEIRENVKSKELSDLMKLPCSSESKFLENIVHRLEQAGKEDLIPQKSTRWNVASRFKDCHGLEWINRQQRQVVSFVNQVKAAILSIFDEGMDYTLSNVDRALEAILEDFETESTELQ